MSVTTTLSPLESLKNEIESTGMMDSRSDDFYQELMDFGIESVSQFEDAYQGQHLDGASFAEQLCEDCGYLEESNLPMFLQNHIDWEAVWSRELRFDYFSIEVSPGRLEFFSNNF